MLFKKAKDMQEYEKLVNDWVQTQQELRNKVVENKVGKMETYEEQAIKQKPTTDILETIKQGIIKTEIDPVTQQKKTVNLIQNIVDNLNVTDPNSGPYKMVQLLEKIRDSTELQNMISENSDVNINKINTQLQKINDIVSAQSIPKDIVLNEYEKNLNALNLANLQLDENMLDSVDENILNDLIEMDMDVDSINSLVSNIRRNVFNKKYINVYLDDKVVEYIKKDIRQILQLKEDKLTNEFTKLKDALSNIKINIGTSGSSGDINEVLATTKGSITKTVSLSSIIGDVTPISPSPSPSPSPVPMFTPQPIQTQKELDTAKKLTETIKTKANQDKVIRDIQNDQIMISGVPFNLSSYGQDKLVYINPKGKMVQVTDLTEGVKTLMELTTNEIKGFIDSGKIKTLSLDDVIKYRKIMNENFDGKRLADAISTSSKNYHIFTGPKDVKAPQQGKAKYNNLYIEQMKNIGISKEDIYNEFVNKGYTDDIIQKNYGKHFDISPESSPVLPKKRKSKNIDTTTKKKGDGLTLSHMKSNPYKPTPDGKLGNIIIDMDQLKNYHKLKITNSNNKQVMNKKIKPDLVELLTKRYNPKKNYDPDSIKMFQNVIKLSDMPIHTGSGKYNLLNSIPINKSASGKILKMFSDPNELLPRMAVLIGEIQAGNNNDMVKNEIMEILDVLLQKGILSKTDHKKIYNQYLK